MMIRRAVALYIELVSSSLDPTQKHTPPSDAQPRRHTALGNSPTTEHPVSDQVMWYHLPLTRAFFSCSVRIEDIFFKASLESPKDTHTHTHVTETLSTTLHGNTHGLLSSVASCRVAFMPSTSPMQRDRRYSLLNGWDNVSFRQLGHLLPTPD